MISIILSPPPLASPLELYLIQLLQLRHTHSYVLLYLLYPLRHALTHKQFLVSLNNYKQSAPTLTHGHLVTAATILIAVKLSSQNTHSQASSVPYGQIDCLRKQTFRSKWWYGIGFSRILKRFYIKVFVIFTTDP